jgi:UDP-N-acetylmuramoylalanine--D-glutamate ligase
MELQGKRVLVVGLAKTGEALCRFLLGKGAVVTVIDKQPEDKLGPRVRRWRARGVTVLAGTQDRRYFLDTDLIVPSPGVPPLPEIEAARAKGVTVLSELEVAYRHLKGTLVGITGSNGKSTTTTLTHKILKDAGRKAVLAGNIDQPLISFTAASRPDQVFVTEISSFQLNYTETFKPAVAAFLNISLNHIDWHGTFESYLQAKKKLLKNLDAGDGAVLNRDDPVVWPLRETGPFETYGFSRRRAVVPGCYARAGALFVADERGKRTELMRLAEIPLPGAHNWENVMAAALMCRRLGVPLPAIRRSVRSFHGLEHRLEKVLTLKGVTFVNDSKATTVDATIKALESFKSKIVVILGGKDKGADFSLLRKPMRGRVKKAILIGQAKDKIRAALEGWAALEDAPSLREAVRVGFESARRGEIVLLAPACASFDMFKNFEDRGRAFKREVRRLAERMRT